MFINRNYVGVCSECDADIFVDKYKQKLDLVMTCECINSSIIRQSWIEAYIIRPILFKFILFCVCFIVAGLQFAELIGIYTFALFFDWLQSKSFTIQRVVYSKRLDGFDNVDDLIRKIAERGLGVNDGQNHTSSNSYFEILGSRDNNREFQGEEYLPENTTYQSRTYV